MTTERVDWAKILVSDQFGQVLVTTDYDSEEDDPQGFNDLVILQTRGRARIELTMRFPSEENAKKAFDAINNDNVEAIRKGAVPAEFNEFLS